MSHPVSVEQQISVSIHKPRYETMKQKRSHFDNVISNFMACDRYFFFSSFFRLFWQQIYEFLVVLGSLTGHLTPLTPFNCLNYTTINIKHSQIMNCWGITSFVRSIKWLFRKPNQVKTNRIKPIFSQVNEVFEGDKHFNFT